MNLDQLQKLCDEASVGPWSKNADGDGLVDAEGWGLVVAASALSDDTANLDFVAAARTALPLLLEVARAAGDMQAKRIDAQGSADQHRWIVLAAAENRLEQALAALSDSEQVTR